MLEEEVYSQNSPIWDQDFLSTSSRTSQLGIQTGKCLALIRQQPEVFVAAHSAFICVSFQENED